MLIWLLKTIKLYINCGIITIALGIILSIIGNFFEQCSKIEHNRPGLNQQTYINYSKLN